MRAVLFYRELGRLARARGCCPPFATPTPTPTHALFTTGKEREKDSRRGWSSWRPQRRRARDGRTQRKQPTRVRPVRGERTRARVQVKLPNAPFQVGLGWGWEWEIKNGIGAVKTVKSAATEGYSLVLECCTTTKLEQSTIYMRTWTCAQAQPRVEHGNAAIKCLPGKQTKN